MTYFNHPTGRICDGRVLVDFYGEYIHHDHICTTLNKVLLVFIAIYASVLNFSSSVPTASDTTKPTREGHRVVSKWRKLCGVWLHGHAPRLLPEVEPQSSIVVSSGHANGLVQRSTTPDCSRGRYITYYHFFHTQHVFVMYYIDHFIGLLHEFFSQMPRRRS